MDEKEIERLARALGSKRARDFDVDTSAIRVLERLRAEREKRIWWKSPVLLRAAAVALLIGAAGGVGVKTGLFTGRMPDIVTPYELNGLSVAQLDEVLDSLTYEAPAFETAGVGLDYLNADQLAELLTALEG